MNAKHSLAFFRRESVIAIHRVMNRDLSSAVPLGLTHCRADVLMLCLIGILGASSPVQANLPLTPAASIPSTQDEQTAASDTDAQVADNSLEPASDEQSGIGPAGNGDRPTSESNSSGQATSGESDTLTAAREKMVIVVGAAGAKEFAEVFDRCGDAWEEVAKRQGWEFCRVAKDDPERSSKQQIRNALAVSGYQRLWLVLIGHGTYAANVAKFNLTGPDLSATELKKWLNDSDCPQVVINCASASAPFLTTLAADNRIVITATQSGSEYNYARFGEYLARTINDREIDLDHDEEISLLEAFLAATKLTQRFYQDASRLATEHALLNDNGDRVGTSGDFYRGVRPVKSSQQGSIDGNAAARIIVFSSPENAIFTQPQRQERQTIEAEIAALRSRKALLDEDDYYDQLEALLLRMAEIYDRAEAAQDSADAVETIQEDSPQTENEQDKSARPSQPNGPEQPLESPSREDGQTSSKPKAS